MRTNLQPEIATTTAQPSVRNERYGCGVPPAGSVRTGLAMTQERPADAFSYNHILISIAHFPTKRNRRFFLQEMCEKFLKFAEKRLNFGSVYHRIYLVAFWGRTQTIK